MLMNEIVSYICQEGMFSIPPISLPTRGTLSYLKHESSKNHYMYYVVIKCIYVNIVCLYVCQIVSMYLSIARQVSNDLHIFLLLFTQFEERGVKGGSYKNTSCLYICFLYNWLLCYLWPSVPLHREWFYLRLCWSDHQ